MCHEIRPPAPALTPFFSPFPLSSSGHSPPLPPHHYPVIADYCYSTWEGKRYVAVPIGKGPRQDSPNATSGHHAEMVHTSFLHSGRDREGSWCRCAQLRRRRERSTGNWSSVRFDNILYAKVLPPVLVAPTSYMTTSAPGCPGPYRPFVDRRSSISGRAPGPTSCADPLPESPGAA